MEVPMTMNTDHHTTETGDDGTRLTIWMFVGLIAVGAVALWFYAT